MEYSTGAIAALAVFGHSALSVFLINRIHATGLPHRVVKAIDVLWYVNLLAVPVFMLDYLMQTAGTALPNRIIGWPPINWTSGYIWVASLVAPVCILRWLIRKRTLRDTWRLESNHTYTVDAVAHLGQPPSGSLSATLATYIPGNQVFQIDVREKSIRMPNLDKRLDGLRITHLSDLHLTGRITQDFYQLIADLANEWPSDLVVITGDIIDKQKCFGWLADVLGRLESRFATCFVLGNHDLRIHDEAGLRSELVRLGMVDLGKRYETISIRGCDIQLAGNELPWFRPAADWSTAPDAEFRIAVSHSPDQIGWARHNRADLMLAGHTHGGQIRFPIIGPVFSPSRFGIRYSAGTYYEKPTLLHVTRGLSGTRPIRINCAPELARLVLRA